jgi:hypothetical protein
MTTEAIRDDVLRNVLWELGRIVGAAEAVGDQLIRIRPDAADANSLAGIASHALGAAEVHVREWALGERLPEDHDAFAEDVTVAQLRARLTAVSERLERAFAQVDLDGSGLTPRGPQPIPAILLWCVLHAGEHAGAAELTRDLLLASRKM